MGNFIKALLISGLIMAVLYGSAHHWGGLEFFIDGQVLEPVLALGVVMVSVMVTLLVVALVIFGLLGSVFMVGGLIALVVVGVVFFSGLVISWPVVLAGVVIWLLVRDKPNKNNSMRY